jgi:hypothetical protein
MFHESTHPVLVAVKTNRVVKVGSTRCHRFEEQMQRPQKWFPFIFWTLQRSSTRLHIEPSELRKLSANAETTGFRWKAERAQYIDSLQPSVPVKHRHESFPIETGINFNRHFHGITSLPMPGGFGQ